MTALGGGTQPPLSPSAGRSPARCPRWKERAPYLRAQDASGKAGRDLDKAAFLTVPATPGSSAALLQPHTVHSALATPAAWIWLLQQSHSELLCWTATIFAKKHKWEKEAALVSSVQQENKSNSRAVSSSRIYGQGEENLSRKRLLELLFSAVKLGNNSKTTPFQAPTTNLRQVRKLSVSPQKNNLQQA